MRRAPFQRAAISTRPETEQEREQRLMDKARRAMNSVVPRAANMGLATTVQPVLKAMPVRSEAYRRAVASLPCASCGVHGYSQAAHANTGKGMGMKACDLQTFPLCADRPGQRGCHSYFDSGALFGKELRRIHECRWVAETQNLLLQRAVVPKKLIPFLEQCHG